MRNRKGGMNMEIAFGIGSVAAISVICYLIGQFVKALPLDDK